MWDILFWKRDIWDVANLETVQMRCSDPDKDQMRCWEFTSLLVHQFVWPPPSDVFNRKWDTIGLPPTCEMFYTPNSASEMFGIRVMTQTWCSHVRGLVSNSLFPRVTRCVRIRGRRPLSLEFDKVRLGGIGTGISEASKRVPIFSFATQAGKQVSSYFRQRNWVQAR